MVNWLEKEENPRLRELILDVIEERENELEVLRNRENAQVHVSGSFISNAEVYQNGRATE